MRVGRWTGVLASISIAFELGACEFMGLTTGEPPAPPAELSVSADEIRLEEAAPAAMGFDVVGDAGKIHVGPEEPVVEKVDYDFAAKGYHLCITDTKGSHADLTPDYAAVPAEMKSVAAYFGKAVLHEITEEDVLKNINALREQCGDRAVLRALHFFEENKRVQKETEALKTDDFSAFLDAVAASGASSFQYLQNVYTNHDITHQNVSISLQLAGIVLKGRGAARVHGGGFAGTMQAWVPEDLVSAYVAQMDAVFGEGACSVLGIRSCGGMKVI